MKRVTDEDLEALRFALSADDETSWPTEIVTRIRAELLALRKVAEAAVMFVRAEPDDTLARDRLDKAIDEAGL